MISDIADRARRGICALVAGTLMTAAGARADDSTLNVAAADNAFGFRLLEAVQHLAPATNVVLSPLSAALDLSMVLNAAAEQTKQEMLSVLALEGSELDVINAANAELITMIRMPVKSVTLSVADSLWANSRRVQLRADYASQMQSSYEAQIDTVDFSRPGTITRINEWASQTTQGKIPSVIDRLDSAELALLLNAVYFKGQWTHPFDSARTQMQSFTLAAGAVKQVSRMAQAGRFDYFQTPQMQAIRLPFGEGDLAMIVILPTKSSSLSALEKNLSSATWATWKNQYSSRHGTIELPRFELKSHYRLTEALRKLGMVRVFQANDSQLPGMFVTQSAHSASSSFFISQVLQSSYWKVDEEGAEAAAVTSIGVRTAAVARSAPPFQMIVDRPFFCAIEDRRSGVLLFVAAIYDPST